MNTPANASVRPPASRPAVARPATASRRRRQRRRWWLQARYWLARRAKSRALLWSLLVMLVAGLLVLVVWMTGRYESSAAQSRLEADASALASQTTGHLGRNLRTLLALPAERGADWQDTVDDLLMRQRELVRVEWRDAGLRVRQAGDSPYRPPVFSAGRTHGDVDVGLACRAALRLNGAAYSASYYVPQPGGLGVELMDVCIVRRSAGELAGFTVATYALGELLAQASTGRLARDQAAAFTEADGTRLAIHGYSGSGSQLYVAKQLLDLPGTALVLRLESRQGTADLFPNMLTALVTAMTLALLAVLVLLARDMRRRLKVENDLAEALAFRKAMEDSLSTGLRARDLQGRITYVNPAFCKMVGVEAGALLNSQATPAPYWPPELAKLYQNRQAFRQSHNVVPRGGHESVFMRSDGTRFPVLIIEAPLINAQGRHTGWMSAILDLSEQKRVEELSRASQERLQATARLAMVGEMASLLSHELNQPLAAISSYANGSVNLLQDALREGEPPPGELRRLAADLDMALRRIAEQASRAGRVIRSVNDLVRRREQRREPARPMDLLDAVMPLVSLQARKLAVRVTVAVEPGCPDVLCDRTMVEQVLLNLARNGMQAMQQLPPDASERQLQLRVQPRPGDGRRVEFAVADAGQGICQDVAAQMFTPFFTTKEEGMGLGLSLCRTVVEQHGGTLAFAANEPRGTIFVFDLPAAAPPGLSSSRP